MSCSPVTRSDHCIVDQARTDCLQVPHPMFPTFELRVQTDGEVTPKEAVIATCTDLVNDLSTLSREFTKEWELRKMVGTGQDGTNVH